MRSAYLTLLRARQALLEGAADQDCFLTPRDTTEMHRTVKDMNVVLSDIRKLTAKFEIVSEARVAISV